MSAQKQTFKVTCANCAKPFHVRFPLVNPNGEGEAKVVVNCLYCHTDVIVPLPRQYVAEEHLLRGIQSHQRGG